MILYEVCRQHATLARGRVPILNVFNARTVGRMNHFEHQHPIYALTYVPSDVFQNLGAIEACKVLQLRNRRAKPDSNGG